MSALPDYDPFSSLIKSARPERRAPGPPGDGLARIRRRKRRRVRSRRRRTAAVAAVFLLLIPVLVQTDVISNVLDFIEIEGPEWVGRIFRTQDGSLAFNVLGDRTDEEIADYGQQILADQGTVTGAEGYVINGETLWLVIQVYQTLWGEQESGRQSRDPANRPSAAHRDFILNDWEEYSARIEDGSLGPVGTETIVLEGRSFLMSIWEMEHPRYGTIRYYAGDVLPLDPPDPED